MIKTSSHSARSDYILVLLLLIFSGNPIIRFLDKSILLVLSILIIAIKYAELKKDFFAKFFIIASTLLVLFIFQNIILHFVSWLGAFRYIFNFLFGGLIFYLVSNRFSYRFFIVLYYLSLISLILFVLINLMGVNVPGIVWGGRKPLTYIVYTYVIEPHRYRNCGMFWEPGAFAGILVLCLALNLKYLPMLWKYHKFKIVVVITALLTTTSTTGYLVFFIIIIYYLIFFIKSNIAKIAIIPSLVLISIVVYENAEFLQEKINEQSATASSLYKGEYSRSRFGSFMVDMHYIKKHPIIGNGLNEKTRYADDPLLIQQMKSAEPLGNANGFSNYLASLGIPFMFFYLFFTYKTMSKISRKEAFLVIIVIVLIFWGEQWLQFPMFTGILFINIASYNFQRYRPRSNYYVPNALYSRKLG